MAEEAKNVEETVEAPAEATDAVETTEAAAGDAVAEKPAEVVAEKPAEAVAEKPAEAVAEKPAEVVAEKPVQKRSAPPLPEGAHYVWGTGRRKRAVARVRIRPGSGNVLINKRESAQFFPALRDQTAQPLM